MKISNKKTEKNVSNQLKDPNKRKKEKKENHDMLKERILNLTENVANARHQSPKRKKIILLKQKISFIRIILRRDKYLGSVAKWPLIQWAAKKPNNALKRKWN